MVSNKILVTGADGFIGSHLVERLVRSGRAVRAMVLYNARDSRGWLDHVSSEVSEQFEVFAGDVRDQGSVRGAMQGCEAVMHLAALIGIPYSYQVPYSYIDTNVVGTLNVLEAARGHPSVHVIQTSTSEVYGTAREVPITEAHALNAQSPYAASKIAADQLALSFHASFGLPVTVVRPFNTYGPRQSMRAVIPTIITQLARGEQRLRLGSLHPTRDLNFVADVTRAFEAALDAPAAIGQVVNVGSGYEISVGDLAKLIGEEMGACVEIVSEEARVRPQASEVERLLASNDRARALLGWTPQTPGKEGLRLGLRKTIEWFTQPVNLDSYRSGTYTV
ncbi:MAG: SDR family NAD(P)-dependent oxidoreductase [Gammaproteobacteria bacterium]|nr:SDR family NAD(P)-dependent oxidoreductase [Gammaproteobacteria bacterium]